MATLSEDQVDAAISSPSHDAVLPSRQNDAAVFPPLEEEVANTITHGLGLAAAVLSMYWLMGAAFQQSNATHVIACGVYGFTLIVCYAASTLYHGVQEVGRKRFFQLVDHVCIYLLIAGTYTPFALIHGGGWGWAILTLVWVFALAGIAIKIIYADCIDSMSYLPYIAIGWLAAVAAKPILTTFPTDVLILIGLGGLSYTVGVYFVVANRRFYHSIWHLFVLGGSACHYVAVIRFVDAHTF